jgi:hypothetical protein
MTLLLYMYYCQAEMQRLCVKVALVASVGARKDRAGTIDSYITISTRVRGALQKPSSHDTMNVQSIAKTPELS